LERGASISVPYRGRPNSSWPSTRCGSTVASVPSRRKESLLNTSRIAARVRRIKPSPSTSAADRANELRRQGKSIVNLVVGEPDFDTPAHIARTSALAMDNGATLYALMAGTVELRQAIVAKLQ